MRSLRLALALIRIPRLFATLFLLPLLLSMIVVALQVLFTALLVRGMDSDARPVDQKLSDFQENNFARAILFGSGKPLPSLLVCRWVTAPAGTVPAEAPPSPECAPDRLDIAIHTDHPDTFEVTRFAEAFEGNVERLHLCRSCRPDVVINTGLGETVSDIYSVWGLLIINLIRFNPEQYVSGLREFEGIQSMFGERFLHIEGFRAPITLNSLYKTLALGMNVACLIVIALWLALKAHRKVLDYFARSGALLPMVAATGKGSFYGALWILTIMRVGAFLLAAIPVTWFGLFDLLDERDLRLLRGENASELILWCAAIGASFALATLIASISDLKHRHALLSFAWRYIPLVLCLAGGGVWAITFLLESESSLAVRQITTMLPLVGTAPVLVAPVFRPDFNVLAVHTLLTAGLITLALKRNARWFAAHLEDL